MRLRDENHSVILDMMKKLVGARDMITSLFKRELLVEAKSTDTLSI